AAYHFGAMRDETVELTGERRDLSGKSSFKAASATLTNASKPFADASKRHQSEMDLESNGGKQADTERGKPPEQGPVETRHIRFHLADIARDHEAKGAGLLDSLRRAGKRDTADKNAQALMVWTVCVTPCEVVAARCEVFRHERLIPQGAGGLRLRVHGLGHFRLDLPVPAG